MAVKTYTQEFESSVPAARFFKAFCVDSHNILPKVLPDSYNIIVFVLGDSAAPGSVKIVRYASGVESICVKHKMEEVDMDNFYYKYTVTPEGVGLDQNIECIEVEEKIEAKSTGCVAKIISHFHTKGDAELDEEKLKFGKELIIETFRVVEEYLQSNPDVYA